MELLIMFLVFLGFSLVVANISKERDIGFWTLLAVCFLLTPIIGLIVGLCARKKHREEDFMQSQSDESNKGFFSNIFGKKSKNDANSPPQDLDMPDFGDTTKAK